MFKQDVPTRWNSKYEMCRRFLRFMPAVLELCIKEKMKNSPTAEDWENLKDMVDVLAPLYQVTKELSEESHTSVSKVIPFTNALITFYEEFSGDSDISKSLAARLFESLTRRLGWVETKTVTCVSTLLDPRYVKTWTGQAYLQFSHCELSRM